VLAALAIRADMRRRDAWSVAYVDRETGRLVYVGDSWRVALGYIVSRYSSQASVAGQMAVSVVGRMVAKPSLAPCAAILREWRLLSARLGVHSDFHLSGWRV